MPLPEDSFLSKHLTESSHPRRHFRKWEGSTPKDHITEIEDSHNIHIDSAKTAATDRASSDGSSASDAGKSNQKAKVDHPEAPELVIGMTD